MNWFTEPMPDEVSYDEILKKAENGEFHKWNFQPVEEFQANGYEDVIDEIKKYTAVDYLKLRELKEKAEKEGDKASAQEYADKMEAMTQAVMKIYRDKNIFPIQYFSEFGILDEIAKCIAYKAEFDGNTVSCVTGDTEFFNGYEWKRIDEYVEGDKVLQYNPDGTATLVDPLRYIHYQSDDPFYLYENGYDLSTCLTGNHDVVILVDEDHCKYQKIKMEDIVKGMCREDIPLYVPLVFRYGGDVEVDPDFMLLMLILYSLARYNSFAPGTVVYHDGEFIIDFDKAGFYWEACSCEDEYLGKFFLTMYRATESGVSFSYTSDKILKIHCEDFKTYFFEKDNSPRFNGDAWNKISSDSKDKFWDVKDEFCPNYTDYILTCAFPEDYDAKQFFINSIGKASMYETEYIDKMCCSDYVGVSEYYIGEGSSEVYEEIYEKDKYCFTVPSHMLVLRRKKKIFITGNCGAGIGTSLCNYLFPNLYDTPSAHDLDKENARSLFEKFHNDKYLRRAIEFCFGYKNGCPVPTSVTGGLRLVGSAPTNFRPMNAKAIYERFCPKGGTIYDFCCVSGDTEYFNGYEWKPISEYDYGDKVLQYNEDGTAELVLPLEYINYSSTDPFYEYQSTGHLRTCQTGNHDVVYKTTSGDVCKIKQERILKGFDGLIPITVKYKGKDRTPSEKKILFVATALKGDDWRNSLDCFDWSLNSKLQLLNKLFHHKNTLELHEEKTVSIISDLIRMSGHVSSVVKSDEYWKLTWRTKGSARDEWYASYDCIHGEFKEVKDTHKYCFVVPSHMLVLKRKGEIYVTGNCGFGGRLLGALSSKNNYKYVGTDPCTETMYHLHQLGEYIEQVTGREDSYELHCCGSEEFKGPKNSIDFAFSSPPYFNLEVYSDEPTQCFNKFPELDEWLEGYVRATIKNIKHMLKPGKLYAVNIADFKVGSGNTVAYVDEWIRISKEEGMPLFDTVYLGVTARAGSAEQAAGELKKENILIFKKPLW